MRNLSDVIDQILEVIPKRRNTSFIHALKDIQSSVKFAAPEMHSFWWNQCYEILSEETPNPTGGWKKEVENIFSGKTNR
jgi:hypothetical protein